MPTITKRKLYEAAEKSVDLDSLLAEIEEDKRVELKRAIAHAIREGTPIDEDRPHEPIPGTWTQPDTAPRPQEGRFDDLGREIVSPLPVAPPVGYVKQLDLVQLMRQRVQNEYSRYAEEAGFESFEEANDFEIGDDYEPNTIYEQSEYDPSLGRPGQQVVTPTPPAAAAADAPPDGAGK